MSDQADRYRHHRRREQIEASLFLRRTRRDFEDDDLSCNLCFAEMYASFRALHAVAAPGMSEREIDVAAWRWMFTDGPWSWKRKPRWWAKEAEA